MGNTRLHLNAALEELGLDLKHFLGIVCYVDQARYQVQDARCCFQEIQGTRTHAQVACQKIQHCHAQTGEGSPVEKAN